ncbi:MAG: hypothetical protein ACKVX7_17410 [Planctomycetota bacterium]
MQADNETTPFRKPYTRPELKVHGDLAKLTGWFGGPWGEYFGGPVSGWNPWTSAPGS